MQKSIKGKILVIDDEPDIGWIFSKILSENGYQVHIAKTGEEGITKIREKSPGLVFLDMKLPGIDGLETLKNIKEIDKNIVVIMITGYESVEDAVGTMKLGAYDYITKPIPADRLKIIADHAFDTQELTKKVEALQHKLRRDFSLSNIVGNSQQIQKIIDNIEKISQYDITVLIKGESGTGKDLVAQAIHYLSPRAKSPFIPIDCAVLPESLVESELFGYEKGAFTGADCVKIGKIESANGGTVFLDEIGNMVPHIQGKLLRVIQEKKIERLGGKKPVDLNVRIIAATNLNLEEAIKKGLFREDLYHRLNEFPIHLPPLRERREDILLIAQYFIDRFNEQLEKKIKSISPQAQENLLSYHWPGNVRELKNVIRRAVLMGSEVIEIKDLPVEIQNRQVVSSGTKENEDNNLKKLKKKVTKQSEKTLILKVLEENHWNKRKTAKILGV
ncbi:MAG: sigma-54 dependent transcriptional regulator, partial [bacterium]